jgi:MFS family permease
VLGIEIGHVGLLLAVVPLAVGVTAPVSGWLSDRIGTRPITVAGLVMVLVGFLTMGTLTIDTSIPGFLLRSLPLGIGLGTFQSPNNSAIMGSAQRDRLGVVSSMLSVTRTLGQTTGIALLGAIWAGRVLFYTGFLPEAGAAAAPAAAQVAGLRDAFHVGAALVGLALILSISSLLQERRTRSGQTPESERKTAPQLP